MTRLYHLPSLENFSFHLLHWYLSFFHLFVFTSISHITLWADFVMGRLCYVPSGFGCLLPIALKFSKPSDPRDSVGQ